MITHLVNGALLLAIVGGSALVWPSLPEQVPGHFGGGGVRWDDKSAAGWFALPVLTVALTLLLYGLAALLPSRPQLFNMPDRKRFLALPPELKAPVLLRMQEVIHALATPTIVLLGLAQYARFRTAQGDDPSGYMLLILVSTVLMTPLVFAVLVPRLQREVQAQISRHERSVHEE